MEQFRGEGVCRHDSILLFSVKAENAADCLGDHVFFVGANYADRNPAGRRGNHALIRGVSLFVELDSKEFQPVADPGTDGGRVLSDAGSEHQRVQSAERRRERADPFLDLVTE